MQASDTPRPHSSVSRHQQSSQRQSRLSHGERVLYILLGVPALGLSLGVTTLAAYVPVLATELTGSRTLIGVLVGPLATGAAIDLLHPVFRSTDGYAAMWPVIGSSALLSVLLLPRSTSAPTGDGA